jgi:hypothetical protein
MIVPWVTLSALMLFCEAIATVLTPTMHSHKSIPVNGRSLNADHVLAPLLINPVLEMLCYLKI